MYIYIYEYTYLPQIVYLYTFCRICIYFAICSYIFPCFPHIYISFLRFYWHFDYFWHFSYIYQVFLIFSHISITFLAFSTYFNYFLFFLYFLIVLTNLSQNKYMCCTFSHMSLHLHRIFANVAHSCIFSWICLLLWISQFAFTYLHIFLELDQEEKEMSTERRNISRIW